MVLRLHEHDVEAVQVQGVHLVRGGNDFDDRIELAGALAGAEGLRWTEMRAAIRADKQGDERARAVSRTRLAGVSSGQDVDIRRCLIGRDFADPARRGRGRRRGPGAVAVAVAGRARKVRALARLAGLASAHRSFEGVQPQLGSLGLFACLAGGVLRGATSGGAERGRAARAWHCPGERDENEDGNDDAGKKSGALADAGHEAPFRSSRPCPGDRSRESTAPCGGPPVGGPKFRSRRFRQ